MSQYNFGNLESPVSGTTLINTHLEPWRDALHSSHGGTSRPSYAVAGMIWINNNATPWVLNCFDGTDDISLGTINATTNAFTPSIANGTITLAMMADLAQDRFIGRASGAGTGVPTSLTAAQAKTILGISSFAETFLDDANAAAVRATIASAGTGVTNTFTGAQIGAVTALTSSSGSIAIDLAVNNCFSHTFTENTTLANPSNATAGQAGQIAFTQHASSAKTLAFGSNWKELSSGTAPSVSTTTSAINVLSYYVVDSTHIYYTLGKAGVS